MNRTYLPNPPNPVTFNSVPLWQEAVYAWMQKVKSRIEADSSANVSPMAPFAVGTYTASSTVTGTDALSNFVATLVASMLNKGLVATNSQRLGS